jgi:hypothetical protein
MTRLPPALSIAIWYVAAIWAVALLTLVCGAPANIVLVAATAGLGVGAIEWLSDRKG